MSYNSIGLDQGGSVRLSEKLSKLLANYSVFYQNVRGFHWNIKGEKFFELHLKFEELYNDLQLKMDEVAERILTLGSQPEHRFSIYLEQSDIKETPEVSNGKQAIGHILDAFRILMIQQREILSISGELEDEGTNALMSDYIRAQEKLVWMYSAYLNQ